MMSQTRFVAVGGESPLSDGAELIHKICSKLVVNAMGYITVRSWQVRRTRSV